VRLIGLGNEATALSEIVLRRGGELGKGADRQMADEVRGEAAAEEDLAGDVEWCGGGLLLGGDESAGEEQPAREQPGLSLSCTNHGINRTSSERPKDISQGLKPIHMIGFIGTTEVVP